MSTKLNPICNVQKLQHFYQMHFCRSLKKKKNDIQNKLVNCDYSQIYSLYVCISVVWCSFFFVCTKSRIWRGKKSHVFYNTMDHTEIWPHDLCLNRCQQAMMKTGKQKASSIVQSARKEGCAAEKADCAQSHLHQYDCLVHLVATWCS